MKTPKATGLLPTRIGALAVFVAAPITATAAGGLGVGYHLAVVMADADPPAGNQDADRPADQPPRQAI